MCPIKLALGWRSVGLGPDLTGHFELLVHLAYILVVSCDTLMGAPAKARCQAAQRCKMSGGFTITTVVNRTDGKLVNLTYVHCCAAGLAGAT